MGHSLGSVRSKVCELLCLALPVPVMGTMAEGVVGKVWAIHIKCLEQCYLLLFSLPLATRSSFCPVWVSHGCNPMTPGEFLFPLPTSLCLQLSLSHVPYPQKLPEAPALDITREAPVNRRKYHVCPHNDAHFIKHNRKSTTDYRNKMS